MKKPLHSFGKRGLVASVCAALMSVVMALPAFAETCEEKFARLEIEGNAEKEPVRLTITSEMPGGMVMRNYHYSDANGDGMSEMIEPENMAWSLFVGNDMYSSNDKGKTWSHMNSWDKEKLAADAKVTLRKDMETASGIACGEESIEGSAFDTVEGTYKSTALQGANHWSKFWVSRDDGKIVRKDSIVDGAGGQYKTSQLIETWPDFVLPRPE